MQDDENDEDYDDAGNDDDDDDAGDEDDDEDEDAPPGMKMLQWRTQLWTRELMTAAVVHPSQPRSRRSRPPIDASPSTVFVRRLLRLGPRLSSSPPMNSPDSQGCPPNDLSARLEFVLLGDNLYCARTESSSLSTRSIVSIGLIASPAASYPTMVRFRPRRRTAASF